jgi:outer membrane protein OmpA-like peptidoglycan-associated protein
MTEMANHRTQIYAAAVISFSAALGLCPAAWGQSSVPVDPAELIEALKEKKGVTRGFSSRKMRAEADRDEKRKKIIEALKRNEKMKARGLSIGESPSLTLTQEGDFNEEYQEAKSNRPFAEIIVYFDYDSASIRSESMPDLAALGNALLSQQLSDTTFVVEGHTDAKGSEEYNQDLSERRASAVKNYLVNNIRVPESRLTVIGRGEDELKLPGEPNAAQNRRVQVVNFGRVADSN